MASAGRYTERQRHDQSGFSLATTTPRMMFLSLCRVSPIPQPGRPLLHIYSYVFGEWCSMAGTFCECPANLWYTLNDVAKRQPTGCEWTHRCTAPQLEEIDGINQVCVELLLLYWRWIVRLFVVRAAGSRSDERGLLWSGGVPYRWFSVRPRVQMTFSFHRDLWGRNEY